MIVFLRGTIAATGVSFADVDVHGVGYRVFVTEPHAATLAVGHDAYIYTHYHVREDVAQLFGFISVHVRDWFELLIGVTGIGPRGALQMLSGFDVAQLAAAIEREDTEALTRLPGVGKKTAQRLIIELKDKVGKLGVVTTEWSSEVKYAPQNQLERDAVEALIALGYNEKQASEEIRAVLADGRPFADVSALLRAALQRLAV